MLFNCAINRTVSSTLQIAPSYIKLHLHMLNMATGRTAHVHMPELFLPLAAVLAYQAEQLFVSFQLSHTASAGDTRNRGLCFPRLSSSLQILIWNFLINQGIHQSHRAKYPFFKMGTAWWCRILFSSCTSFMFSHPEGK